MSTVRFNGLFLAEREDSSATDEDIRLHALQMANSASEGIMNWFVLTHDTRTNSLQITYSDQLREQLSLEETHYLLVEAGSLTGDEINTLRDLNARLSPDTIDALLRIEKTYTQETLERLLNAVSQMEQSGVVKKGFNPSIGDGGVTVLGGNQ